MELSAALAFAARLLLRLMELALADPEVLALDYLFAKVLALFFLVLVAVLPVVLFAPIKTFLAVTTHVSFDLIYYDWKLFSLHPNICAPPCSGEGRSWSRKGRIV